MASDVFSTLGLKANPFPPGACREAYFHTAATKRFLDELLYGIQARKGFLVLTGEVGHGKTSLLLQLLPVLDQEGVETAWIFNTIFDKEELLWAIARDFGMNPAQDDSLSSLVSQLHEFFIKQAKKGKNCAIIVDEAHNLEKDALEGLRMLSNLELEGEKLVQILLVGQPELMARMQQEDMRQLRSRVNIFLNMEPLSREETANYVNFKLSAAGSQLRLSGKALDKVWAGSCGSLRLINLIMEKSLYALVATNQSSLTESVVREALQDIAACHGEVRRALDSPSKSNLAAKAGLALGGALLLTAAVLYVFAPPGFFADMGTRAPVEYLPPAGERQSQKQAAAEQPAVLREPAPAKELETTPEQAAVKAPKTGQPGAPDPDLAAFLDDLGLPGLAVELERAVNAQDAGMFARVLPANLQAAELDALPPGRGELYHAVAWRKKTGSGPRWLGVWKPTVVIPEPFEPDMEGEPVKELQRLLADLGYYDKAIDGRYGSGTWRAVYAFQREQGLQGSGEPSPETVLWLTAMGRAVKR